MDFADDAEGGAEAAGGECACVAVREDVLYGWAAIFLFMSTSSCQMSNASRSSALGVASSRWVCRARAMRSSAQKRLTAVGRVAARMALSARMRARFSSRLSMAQCFVAEV